MPLGVHPGFLIILLLLVLIVFGPGKLPQVGSALGRTLRDFRKTSSGDIDDEKDAAASGKTRLPPQE
jgi:sec-independent protein translocase protein TatA